jgi:hypothetical protein
MSNETHKTLRTFAKWFAGVVAGAAILAFIVPPLTGFRDSLFKSGEDEELATKIALEQPEATVRELFGPSSYERDVLDTGEVTWTEIGWARDGWLVTGIFNADKQLRAFSIVSCDSDFAPTFTRGLAEPVTLQSQTLASLEPDADIELVYNHQSFPSSVDVLTDVHDGFSVGVSSVCGDTDFAHTGEVSSSFIGPLSEASADVVAFRSVSKPNFYAEQSNLISRSTSGELTVDLGDDGIVEHLNANDAPSRAQVPPAVIAALRP